MSSRDFDWISKYCYKQFYHQHVIPKADRIAFELSFHAVPYKLFMIGLCLVMIGKLCKYILCATNCFMNKGANKKIQIFSLTDKQKTIKIVKIGLYA